MNTDKAGGQPAFLFYIETQQRLAFQEGFERITCRDRPDPFRGPGEDQITFTECNVAGEVCKDAVKRKEHERTVATLHLLAVSGQGKMNGVIS